MVICQWRQLFLARKSVAHVVHHVVTVQMVNRVLVQIASQVLVLQVALVVHVKRQALMVLQHLRLRLLKRP
jgi:hypothetical protein